MLGANLEKMSIPAIAEKIILVFAVLFPFFFLPLTADLFDFNKRFLLFLITGLLLLLGSIQAIKKREIHLTRNPWTTPIALFGLATLVTVIAISPNKVMAFLGNGGMYIAFALFFLAGSSLVERGFTRKLLGALTISGVILTLVTLFDRFGSSLAVLLNGLFGLAIPNGTRIFLSGSPLFSVFFLSVVVLMLVVDFVKHWTAKPNVLALVFGFVCVIGILVNGEALLPGKVTHPQFLSFLDSWSVATDVLKAPLNAVLGVGTDSYANAFSIFRPLRVNQSPLWFVRFNNARNSFLELMTTQGVFGVALWLLIFLTTLRFIRLTQGGDLALGVGALAVEGLFLFFPPNIILVSLFGLLLVAWSASLKENNIRTKDSVLSLFAYADFSGNPAATGIHKTHKLIAQVVGILVLVATFAGFFALGRAYAAEYWFNRSLSAAAKGSARDTYDFAVLAITTNPFMENYHRVFALTNLSLAQNLSQKKTLTDAEKQNVLTLIQQAIQQAKIATTLDPLNTSNWDNLTTVYQSLIGAAQGADQWTIASFVEQIKTDPSNPQARFNLGTVYRQLGNDELALQLFQQAAQLKPDYANAYYNMADIYKKKGDKTNELAMLQATLSYITPDQTGYQAVKTRIEELQGQSKAAPAPKPTPTPTPSVGKVTLPTDAGPQPPVDTTVPSVPQQ